MLPGLTVPGSLAELLQGFRSCFRLRPFEVFCLLAVGMVTQTGLCTVTGMLTGAGMQTMISHHRHTGSSPPTPGRPTSWAWRWPG
jgi:hypothetical protein